MLSLLSVIVLFGLIIVSAYVDASVRRVTDLVVGYREMLCVLDDSLALTEGL